VRVLLLLLLAGVAFAGEPVRVIVVHTNDLHGQLEPLPPSPVRGVLRNRPAGGFAHLASMVRAARREAADSGARFLLLDAGDIFQGTPVGNETRGDSVVAVMNALAYDAVAVGNHEFDFGIKNLERLVERARFPMLAANMSDVKGVKPYVIVGPPRMPCRVAIIGLITPKTPAMTTPDLRGKVKFADPAKTLRGLLKEIDADVHIVVSHLGAKEDLELAEKFPGLALIVSGHSHTPISRRVGGTLVMQTHARGISLGRVNLELDPKTWHVVRSKGTLLPVDPRAVLADKEIAGLIDKHGRAIAERLRRKVGTLLAPARRRGGLGSSSAGNWMADVTRAVGKADIGFMNKGGIRTDLEAGPVTAGDIYRLMPFDNTVVSMTLTGAQLRALLQRHFGYGGYPALEWSGMKVEAELAKGKGRILSVVVDGKPLVDEKKYRVATNSFLARGGDGFGRFKDGRDRATSGVLLRDALAADLAKQSPLRPPQEQRLRLRRVSEAR